MPYFLKHFLEPKSIAIIGASKTAGRPGYMIIENLLNWGFNGDIFPVNPKSEEIMGLKAYKRVEDLPVGIELVLSLAPAEETPKIIEKCANKGIKSIVVVSGGFSESGEEGSRLEEEVVRIAKEKGIRVIGPNAVGPVNTSNNFISPFYPIKDLLKGVASFIAQTGQFSCPVMEFMCSTMRIGVNKSIDLGNRYDVDEADVVEYLEEDEGTKVIGIYMESVMDGRRFVEVAKKVSRKKPIIILKSGRTYFGAKTAASHTGAIAGNDEIFEAALKQAEIIRAWDLEEFIDLIKAFSYLPLLKGNNIGIITYSGGIGALTADACADYGLNLANFSEDSLNRIKEVLFLSEERFISNPIDYFWDGPPPDVDKFYKTVIDALMADKNVDAMLFCIMVTDYPRTWVPNINLLINTLKYGLKNVKKPKPVIAWITGKGSIVKQVEKELEEKGIPTFPSPERAVRALSTLYKYTQKSQ